MKQPDGRKKRKKPEKPDGPAVSYTPEQRRLIRNGLGIWARVAIRSYLRKHGSGFEIETGPMLSGKGENGEEEE